MGAWKRTSRFRPTKGKESVMRFTGIYKPEQLAMLSKVLDDYCREHRIERPGPGYEDASYLVLALFRDGARTIEEMKTAIAAVLTGKEQRQV
jgi:hypothetical protein